LSFEMRLCCLTCSTGFINTAISNSALFRWAAAGPQVMAYFTISAVAMAMEAGLISKFGTPQFQWMPTCQYYKRFCTQASGGLACATAASFNMVAIALISAFNLFRLYGSGKGGRK
jgi:uncharacterized protein (TIGR01569 family)